MVHSASTKSIISPAIDVACTGGISLVVAVCVILFAWTTQAGVERALVAVEAYLLTDLLINWPHFMASYRILYAKKANLTNHPTVTVLFPIFAIAFLLYVLLSSGSQAGQANAWYSPPMIIRCLEWVAPVMLGWHYTGQSWGMTACFAYLNGFKMNEVERRLIRAGFYALCAHHACWVYESMGFFDTLGPNESGKFLISAGVSLTRTLVFVGFIVGLIGFRKLSKRSQRAIPAYVWLPWLATFSWYVMIDFLPQAFFLLQVFHALQYLTFPMRVEMNEHVRGTNFWRHMIIYYVLLVACGMFAFDWAQLFSVDTNRNASLITASFIILNLHHYFIDAVIWKIRNPEVRKSLFGHLESSAAR